MNSTHTQDFNSRDGPSSDTFIGSSGQCDDNNLFLGSTYNPTSPKTRLSVGGRPISIGRPKLADTRPKRSPEKRPTLSALPTFVSHDGLSHRLFPDQPTLTTPTTQFSFSSIAHINSLVGIN
jgi:hypothetical protein